MIESPQEVEIWKPVPNYEGLYEVSNLGRVKGLEKIRNRTFPETILKQRTEKNRYKSVKLCNYGKSKRMKVHALVAMAFLNHTPNGHEVVVDHKDNDRGNNKKENLQLITQRENSTKNSKGTSKYMGVKRRKDTGKWVSNINIGYRRIYLGQFENEKVASEYYQEALSAIEKNTGKIKTLSGFVHF